MLQPGKRVKALFRILARLQRGNLSFLPYAAAALISPIRTRLGYNLNFSHRPASPKSLPYVNERLYASRPKSNAAGILEIVQS